MLAKNSIKVFDLICTFNCTGEKAAEWCYEGGEQTEYDGLSLKVTESQYKGKFSSRLGNLSLDT